MPAEDEISKGADCILLEENKEIPIVEVKKKKKNRRKTLTMPTKPRQKKKEDTIEVLPAEQNISRNQVESKVDKDNEKTILKKAPRNLNKRNMRGETPLHATCIKGNVQRVEELLSFGAETNTKDNNGWTPLHEASNHGFYNIVELLVDHGAIIDSVGGDENDTPLHDAVSNGRLQVVEFLLERGAPTNLRNGNGFTPGDLAISSDMKNLFKNISLMSIDNHHEIESEESFCSSSTQPKIFITTNLNENEMRAVRKHCNTMNVTLVNDFDQTVSHVICGTNGGSISRARTLKYMYGIINGKWIVNPKWLNDSASNKTWRREMDYEVIGTVDACDNVPRLARINKLKSLPRLFDGCSFYLTGQFSTSMSKETLTDMIKTSGGKILTREPKTNISDPMLTPISPAMNKLKLLKKEKLPLRVYHTKDNSSQAFCVEYIIYDPKLSERIKQISSPILCTAPTTWLIDCVSSFSIVDIRDEHEKKEGVQTSQE